MEAINQFDKSILLWVQDGVRSDALTPVMKVITYMGDKGILWIVLTLVLIAIKRTRRVGLTCALAMIFGLLFTNLVIKNWVARTRPYEVFDELTLIINKQHDFSFPSGHATNSLATATVMFCMLPRKWGVPALIMAILISLSRIYVGVHYPTDILGGAIIGVGSAFLAMKLTPKIIKRLPEKARRWIGVKKRRQRA